MCGGRRIRCGKSLASGGGSPIRGRWRVGRKRDLLRRRHGKVRGAQKGGQSGARVSRGGKFREDSTEKVESKL
ncbi:unnamed protein product [Linum trigynum]|uniref:Uncharacterized protein n=1 Tax=Linum trigynum TaxID=586398 RepID=A0AAV2FB76_9ROSI